MIRIPAITMLRSGKAGVFTGPGERRTPTAEARRRAGRYSMFLQGQGAPPSDAMPSEPGRDLTTPVPTPEPATPDHDTEQPAEAAAAGGDGVMTTRSVTSPVAAALLSALATATATAALAWCGGDRAWAAGSLLTLVALTAAFLAGRAVLATSGTSGEPSGKGRAYPVREIEVRVPSKRDTWPQRTRSVLAEALRTRRVAPLMRSVGRPEPNRGSAADSAAKDVRGMRASVGEAERLRRHVRIRPRHRSVTVVTEQGVHHDAEVIDLSQSGVALEGTMPGVWIGSMVTVGSRRAKAVRMLPRGMALEFSVPIPERALHANTVL